MTEMGFRRTAPDQSVGSGHTVGTPRHSNVIDPILSKRVCFYKSGDPQFNGLRMVINNRTFKTFDALLDSLSKKVPLPFGVRNITTPRGVHAVNTLDELEDGKSYICSDTRKVKPINLALARKKLPPWYNARPVSSRRRTVQQGRYFAGRNVHKQEPVFMRTPKILVVYRNGDPAVKHSVVLHKRTTPSFESILEYISELLEFRVMKLYTADGRRVDGLPGLILCSGTVVAVGRERFKHASYHPKKPTPPTLPQTKRTGPRRLRSLKSKKKSFTSKSRSFSPSSERYIVNRIHNSIAGSSSNLPSHPESSHALESVPETPETLGVGAEGCDSFLPAEDDIEKSFRVNQDGSMTVEMRVRLTIKEEETIHWTTTLARSSVANQLNVTCLPEPEISSLKSTSLDFPSPPASVDKDKTPDDNEDDPPSLGAISASEEEPKVETPRRVPTPGHKQISKKQASVESVKAVTADGVQEGMFGSYYREETENGTTMGQYCMVRQSNSKPVPKPRRLNSMDANNMNTVSTFKSAGMSEILQIESSSEEVMETVVHVYEEQSCQDSFFANLCAQGLPDFVAPLFRPTTSETGRFSFNTDFEPQPWRPSTASESISIWRAESTSVMSDLTLQRTGANQATDAQQRVPEKPQKREINKDKRTSSKVVNKRVHRLKSPGKRRLEKAEVAAEKSKKVKMFSSAGFIKKIYGTKSKPTKVTVKPKSGQTQKRDAVVSTEAIKRDPDVPSAAKASPSKTVSFENSSLNVAPNDVSQPRGVLTRQTSMHQEKKVENESYDISKSMSLPAFNSSSSAANEYVEDWLQKARPNQPDEESIKSESEKAPGKQTLKTDASPPNEAIAFVKQRILSFENISSPLLVKKKIVCNQPTSKDAENSRLAQSKKEKTLPNHNCPDVTPPLRETVAESEVEIKIALQEEEEVSMELPPPPSPPNTEAVGSQTSDNHPLPISPTSGSPTAHTQEIIHTEAPLTRSPSVKRAPLVSNVSLDRKMSLRKACLDKYTSDGDETSASATSVNVTEDKAPMNGICMTGTQRPSEKPPDRYSNGIIVRSNPSCCTSVSPASLTSEERMSPVSVSSSEASAPLLTQKDEPKPTVKLTSSPSPERKPPKLPAGLPHYSPKLSPDKRSPNIGTRGQKTPNTSPSTERKLHRPKLQKRRSPYSQSLDMVSPPVRHKSSGRLLSRNLSADNPSEPPRTKSSQKKPHQTPESIKPSELDKTATCDAQSDDNKAPGDLTAQITPLSTQPNIKPVLEKICYSIKSIRQITQNKRPSCLEKSNSLPDFSSHVASTFGSSSKALLAFLSVMTLKRGLTDFNMDELNANDVSCAEALKMIDSLREIASIEDSHKLKVSLSELQRSASRQLLESWKGFRDLGDRCKSRSSTPNNSEEDVAVEDSVIDEILENLGIPETLKEELTSLSACSKSDADDDEESNSEPEDVVNVSEEKNNTDVSAIITKFTDINPPKEDSTGSVTSTKPADEQRAEERLLYGKDSEQVNTKVRSQKSLEQDGDTDEEEEQRGTQLQSEGSIPENDGEEELNASSAAGDLQLNVSCQERVSSSEEEPECVENKGGQESSNPESHSEEEEQPSRAEPTVRGEERTSSPDSQTTSSSEEERPRRMGLNVSVDESNSDVDDPPSEEEQPDVGHKKLKVVVEESLSGSEEEEEEPLGDLQGGQPETCRGLNALIEETEEDMIGSDDESHTVEADLIENQDPFRKTDDSLTKSYSFKADEDSGNDHSSCEEHVDVEQPKLEVKINSSYNHKESSSEEEHVEVRHEAPALAIKGCEKVAEELKQQSGEIISQSVAERVILLEKQVANAYKTTESSASRRLSHRNDPVDSDAEDSPRSRSPPPVRSTPQSSLSFSYDSSGVLTTEPEGNRVRSIREMFLAKSAMDVQHRPGRFPSHKTSERSELRADTSASGGYQTQTSSELSSSEDDSAAKSITKGFVRRTIERLYGKKEAKPDEDVTERPLSASKEKKKEHTSIFSPFHIARSKAMSELSYFNSANALDTLTAATRCVALNAQVGPLDQVPLADGQWFPGETTTTIRKSVSDPVGINKNLTQSEGMCGDTEDAPYSLFSTKSELDDNKPSFSRKCTYFSLPHASDSDACQDDLSTASVPDAKEDPEDAKTERNGMLPGIATDLKMMDNKVHPLTEGVVVVQPGKGQGVMSRRIQEPDVLDILYDFCGQNCPIL